MKKTAIQSFILYTDVRPVLDLVPQEDGLQLLKTIFDYAAGEEVESGRILNPGGIKNRIRPYTMEYKKIRPYTILKNRIRRVLQNRTVLYSTVTVQNCHKYMYKYRTKTIQTALTRYLILLRAGLRARLRQGPRRVPPLSLICSHSISYPET